MAAADQPPLGALGWQGEFDYDQPEVAALRAELDASAGIAGLEVVDPSVPGFAEKAAAIFRRDGFVAVKDVLDEDGLETIRGGCDSVIRKMMSHDSARIGNRGSHRYSFGSAPAHFGAFAEWNALVDPPVLIECLNAIFQSPDWWYAHGAASGGDFAMPGATEYQGLHRDTGDYLGDPSGKLDFRDMPTACITVNFPMEVKPGSKVGHSSHNGVTRHIPGTQKSREDIPSLEDEPRWMKLATTNPVPAGSVMIRDQRAWHGGTPNLSKEVRAIPHFGMVCAPWFNTNTQKTLPRSLYEQLSTDGQHACRNIVADTDEVGPFANPMENGTRGEDAPPQKLAKI